MSPRSTAIDGGTAAGGGGSFDPLATASALVLPGIAATCGLLATACGAVLAARRLGGAIAASGPAAAWMTAATGLVLVAVGDLAARGTAASGNRLAWALRLSRVGLLLAVAALAFPRHSQTPVEMLASLAAVGVVLLATGRGLVVGLAARARLRPREPGLAEAATPLPARPAAPAGELLQRIERLCLPDGTECVRGQVTVSVGRGARSGAGHVGFCPPFAGRPTVVVDTEYDSTEVSVTAAEVLPWGIRVECRLDEPAEETIEIPVAVLATAPA